MAGLSVNHYILAQMLSAVLCKLIQSNSLMKGTFLNRRYKVCILPDQVKPRTGSPLELQDLVGESTELQILRYDRKASRFQTTIDYTCIGLEKNPQLARHDFLIRSL